MGRKGFIADAEQIMQVVSGGFWSKLVGELLGFLRKGNVYIRSS